MIKMHRQRFDIPSVTPGLFVSLSLNSSYIVCDISLESTMMTVSESIP